MLRSAANYVYATMTNLFMSAVAVKHLLFFFLKGNLKHVSEVFLSSQSTPLIHF
jgi:hypothetical protein